MKVRLHCEACLKDIGEVIKAEMTSQDLEDYTVMFTCDCGLPACVEVVE
jgi:hypothetical protein